MYYARRYGVPPEIENGQVVTKPEYLIMPASFGMWVAIMVMYIFSTRNGCDFNYMDTTQMFRSKTTYYMCSTYDTSYQHRYFYGTSHDALGTISAVNVLL